MEKLHYPRFGLKDMCGHITRDARGQTEKIADFFATSKKHRCKSCLVLLDGQGYNVKQLIKNFGGSQ